MEELKKLRYEVLNLRNMNEITTNAETKLLHKLNALQEAINYTRCCKSDSEQLCANCLCKPTRKLGFCNECFDNIYSNA